MECKCEVQNTTPNWQMYIHAPWCPMAPQMEIVKLQYENNKLRHENWHLTWKNNTMEDALEKIEGGKVDAEAVAEKVLLKVREN